jgi:hypothetical protein
MIIVDLAPDAQPGLWFIPMKFILGMDQYA